MQLGLKADDEIMSALHTLGRTEDVHFSPSDKLLAVAGFKKDCILILGADMDDDTPHLHTPLLLECEAFEFPHGLFWIDECTLIVANRGREAVVVHVPNDRGGGTRRIYPIQTIHTDDADLLHTPGSVTIARHTPGLLDVLICNNYGHYVTRHLLNERAGYQVVSSDIVCRAGLQIPDGIVFSHDAAWVAVSNHGDHSIYIYRTSDLGSRDAPSGILRGMAYPHGLRFSADGRHLFVADAGAPYVHVFEAEDGVWAGNRQPVTAIRAMDEETFLRGRSNEQEGGPKGLAISKNGRVLIVCCEEQPLAAFDIPAVLSSVSPGPAANRLETEFDAPTDSMLKSLSAARAELASLRQKVASLSAELEQAKVSHAGSIAQADAARAEMARALDHAGRLNRDLEKSQKFDTDRSNTAISMRIENDQLRNEVARLSQDLDHARKLGDDRVASVYGSTSWKVTAPMRYVVNRIRRS